MEKGAVRTGLAALTMVCALLSGCTQGVSAEALEFCQGYAIVESQVVDGPDEDSRSWAEEVSTSLSELAAIVPREVDEPFDRIREAIPEPTQVDDAATSPRPTEPHDLAEALAAIDHYLKAECGWPPWPPSPRHSR